MEMIVLPTLSHFFQTLIDSRGIFLEGMLITLQLTVISIFIGMFIGLFFALLKISRIAVFGYIANAYIFLVRGTPLIVQIFILYFGLTELNIPDFWAASIALAFHNGAYIAEIFRGAIQSIDQGQKRGRTLSWYGSFFNNEAYHSPSSDAACSSPLGNQFIIGLKDSSLAAFISVNELFNVATTQGSNSFDNMTYLLVVAVYYLVLVLLLTFAVQTFEKKLSVSDQ
ncbi:cystine transporter permease [Bacillus safensis]|uniref:Cystine transporter permease n=1 Tax=Bacillus safensis TaxID=561879 RepID=A0A5S9MJJ7_BACIA|nr:cystine transporter permease [Bacillus safensis]